LPVGRVARQQRPHVGTRREGLERLQSLRVVGAGQALQLLAALRESFERLASSVLLGSGLGERPNRLPVALEQVGEVLRRRLRGIEANLDLHFGFVVTRHHALVALAHTGEHALEKLALALQGRVGARRGEIALELLEPALQVPAPLAQRLLDPTGERVALPHALTRGIGRLDRLQQALVRLRREAVLARRGRCRGGRAPLLSQRELRSRIGQGTQRRHDALVRCEQHEVAALPQDGEEEIELALASPQPQGDLAVVAQESHAAHRRAQHVSPQVLDEGAGGATRPRRLGTQRDARGLRPTR
jgi:hypothetical protein